MTNNEKQPDDISHSTDVSCMEPVVPAVHKRTSDDRAVRRAVRYAIIQQVVILFISINVLDGGDVFRLCAVAALLSWAPIVVIGCRWLFARRSKATKLDIASIRYGFWVFFVSMCVLYHYQLLPSNWYFINRVLESHPVLMKHHLSVTANK